MGFWMVSILRGSGGLGMSLLPRKVALDGVLEASGTRALLLALLPEVGRSKHYNQRANLNRVGDDVAHHGDLLRVESRVVHAWDPGREVDEASEDDGAGPCHRLVGVLVHALSHRHRAPSYSPRRLLQLSGRSRFRRVTCDFAR